MRFAVVALMVLACFPAWGQDGQLVATGERITPQSIPGTIMLALNPGIPEFPDHVMGQAVAVARSPDGGRLLALTSGYNKMSGPDGKTDRGASSEWVFVFDVTGTSPRQTQALPVANAYMGLTWSADGKSFYVSGGVDDEIHVFTAKNGSFAEDGAPIKLGHMAGLGVAEAPEGKVPPERVGHEADTKPMVAGLAIDPTGKRLLSANFQNDSVSVIDLDKRVVMAERDLRPGRNDPKSAGIPGGEYPVSVVWAGAAKAYIAAERDREIVVLDLSRPTPRVAGRIAVSGEPNAMVVNARARRLYATLDNSDAVAVIDTATDRLIETIPALGPSPIFDRLKGLRGVNPNGLALTTGGAQLLVSEGGINALAVIDLSPAARGVTPPKVSDRDGDGDDDGDPDSAPSLSRVIGLIPTGWYPNAVALSGDGRTIFAVNGKSVPGPNPGACRDSLDAGPGPKPCSERNQYVLQLEQSSLTAIPAPDGAMLAKSTLRVAANLGLDDGAARAVAEATMAEIRSRIRHVIYIIKENRTYDQILGDLPQGNGDPRLTLFPAPLTPNQHALATDFVTLDNFYDSGEVSGVGWNWSVAGRTTDFTEKTVPIEYAGRGLEYDWEGFNRGINVALPLSARRRSDSAIPDDPDLLPGAADVAAPDAAIAGNANGEAGAGYLWDAALRAGLTLRNYGFYVDTSHYAVKDRNRTMPSRHPFAENIVQALPAKQALAPVTDLYFRGFDQAFPDFWRFQEWKREFDLYVAHGDLPALSLVRLAHDHFGDFADAIDGLGTVDGEMADNDYAVGMLIEAVAASRYNDDTLIFVVEDDAQNGADHVDAHRSIAFIAGPYVRHGAVVSTHFTTLNFLRTIEAALGLPPLGLNDALAAPMAEVFDQGQKDWSFTATVPAALRKSALPLPPEIGVRHADAAGCYDAPRRTPDWWARAMRGQDFSTEDRLDTARFNRALWRGLMGDAPEPAAASGADLRVDRAALLARFGLGCPKTPQAGVGLN
jgi:YVTN family beta-propeller protein